MDAARQRLIAGLGGRTAHKLGVAHQWTAEEAKVAGRKGGQQSALKRKQKKEQEAVAVTA